MRVLSDRAAGDVVTTLAPVFVPVTSLSAGNVVAYGGGQYTVIKVLPIAVLPGFTVTGLDEAGMRHSLVYDTDDASAELLAVTP